MAPFEPQTHVGHVEVVWQAIDVDDSVVLAVRRRRVLGGALHLWAYWTLTKIPTKDSTQTIRLAMNPWVIFIVGGLVLILVLGIVQGDMTAVAVILTGLFLFALIAGGAKSWRGSDRGGMDEG